MADKCKLRRIGVSFSSETGTVDDWKVMEFRWKLCLLTHFLLLLECECVKITIIFIR